MAKDTIKGRAYEARMALEQAAFRLDGIRAAHHLIHGDGGSINTNLLYGLFEILDDSMDGIRASMKLADAVLREAQGLGGNDNGGR
jgi:hypothetical protein